MRARVCVCVCVCVCKCVCVYLWVEKYEKQNNQMCLPINDNIANI